MTVLCLLLQVQVTDYLGATETAAVVLGPESVPGKDWQHVRESGTQLHAVIKALKFLRVEGIKAQQVCLWDCLCLCS